MLRCFFNSIDSTNEEAKLIIKNNSVLPNIFSLISNIQTKGKGKLGNNWKSTEGNLHLSIVINLEKYLQDFKNIGLISILSSVVLRDTIDFFIKNSTNCSNKDVRVVSKWPNDVLVERAKISGILLELEQDIKGKSFLIVGIGANIVSSPLISKYKTISLFEILSEKVNYFEFADVLEDKFFSLLLKLQTDANDIVNMFKENLFGYGENITIKIGDILKTGVFSNITKEGYLILKEKDKETIITAGDIFGF